MRNKKKTKIASPIKSQKGIEIKYRKELKRLGIALVASIRRDVLSYLKVNQSSYVADSLADIAETSLRALTCMICDDALDLDKSLKDSRKKFTNDGLGDQLGVIFKKLNALFSGTAVFSFAQSTAGQMVQAVGKSNKSK